ncbi:MAG: nuclear transport factor 2 family protein [Miltoncostaeaceae bacterium]
MGHRLENAKRLYMEGIRDGRPREAIERYAGARYTQHSTGVPDGKEGFVAFFEDFLARNPEREIDIVRGFEDGRYVFLQAAQTLNGGQFRYVTADIFETDDAGRMVEHWDVIAEMVEETASGRTQIDGPGEPVDLDRTEHNRELVTRFLNDVLVGGRLDRLADFVSVENYAQHNVEIEDGLDGLIAALGRLRRQGQALSYRSVHRVLACGSFVAALSHVDIGDKELAVVDLFRVAEGLIVEHWDVMEEIPPREQWANGGKF